MVTSKRQITKNEDRFGGFSSEAELKNEVNEREFNDDIIRMRSYVSNHENKSESVTINPSVSTQEKEINTINATVSTNKTVEKQIPIQSDYITQRQVGNTRSASMSEIKIGRAHV